jgi:hypothetical protein
VLLHPVALAAMALVIANDRVLKPRWHNELTGKLSDVTGLIFFPLFVVAVAEGVRRLAGVKRWPLTPVSVLRATVVIGVAFVLIKTWHPAGELYRIAIGAVLWPLDALVALVGGADVPPLDRVALVEDRTDLLALPALAVPWWIARRVMDGPRSTQRDDR